MIKGFEKETEKLSEEELLICRPLKAILSAHKGADNAITSGKIIEQLLLNEINIGHSSRLRKLINYVRHAYLPDLAANNKGYYIEEDLNKLKIYAESLRDRASAIISVSERIESHIRDKREQRASESQMSLFTKIS